MTALEEITERFNEALAEQARAEEALDKATRTYGAATKDAKVARDRVTKLGQALDLLTELEPKEEADDNSKTTEL